MKGYGVELGVLEAEVTRMGIFFKSKGQFFILTHEALDELHADSLKEREGTK